MKFEKITDDKIKIFLSLSELQKNNIDYHSFMSNSPIAQNLFLSLLEEANLKLGFNTENCKVIIETLSISNETFIFTITKTTNPTIKKSVRAKRKHPSNCSTLCIYKFSCINDFIDFARNSHFLDNLESSLYKFNNCFYLIINLFNVNTIYLNKFYYSISEFGDFIDLSIMPYLLEHGFCIIKANALSAFNFY